jgi:excisionase family DNA binding protein
MPFVKADKVAEFLSVSKARVYELARLGLIPSSRITKRQVRFNLEAIEAKLRGEKRVLEDDEQNSAQDK